MPNLPNSMTASFTDNPQSSTLSVLDIVEGTSVDGVGLRTSIYLAGCENGCAGCHNPQSWDIRNGTPYSVDNLFDIVCQADMNVTFSGGDPLLQASALTPLARRIKEEARKTIWCYTGYCFEALLNRGPARELLAYVDVLVDGPFILAERDLSLRFRGSRNQRLIDVPSSLREGRVITYIL